VAPDTRQTCCHFNCAINLWVNLVEKPKNFLSPLRQSRRGRGKLERLLLASCFRLVELIFSVGMGRHFIYSQMLGLILRLRLTATSSSLKEHFVVKHSSLFHCSVRGEEKKLYNIGPRVGIHKMSYDYLTIKVRLNLKKLIYKGTIASVILNTWQNNDCEIILLRSS